MVTKMTLTKKSLAVWKESMRISLTEEQQTAILKHFGREPHPHVWSDQDIAEQLRNYIDNGVFVKPVVVNGTAELLPDDMPF